MKYTPRYTPSARKDLGRIPPQMVKRITSKVAYYCSQQNPLRYAKKLSLPMLGEYRFRIGDWRVIFDVDKGGIVVVLLVLTVKHRKDVYRGL
ncbi:MAG: type II toxin-antitoxin system RelE/ParE family toxin [Parcubacteria group bacterium]|nr:type II toxin-antitoxin system RelE/ParE family toxin [Parcubacteria group bacterium]